MTDSRFALSRRALLRRGAFVVLDSAAAAALAACGAALPTPVVPTPVPVHAVRVPCGAPTTGAQVPLTVPSHASHCCAQPLLRRPARAAQRTALRRDAFRAECCTMNFFL